MAHSQDQISNEMIRTNRRAESVACACICITEEATRVCRGDSGVDEGYTAALNEVFGNHVCTDTHRAIYQFAWEIETAWQYLNSEEVREHIGGYDGYDYGWIPFVMSQLHAKRYLTKRTPFHIFDANYEDILKVTCERLEEMKA